MDDKMKVLTGFCPDPNCNMQLYFPSNTTDKVLHCVTCGQHHKIEHLKNTQPVTDPATAIRTILQNILKKSIPEHMKTNCESIKVKGLSNYTSKLVSPLLTKYGLEKNTQKIKLLSEMGQGQTFDCSHLSDRAFLIEEENLLIAGYGRDTSVEYLKDTLNEVYKVNNNEENIVPIYVDGDGHCLLHAISRALVGREIFWHSLATNLKSHFVNHQKNYKALFKDFIEEEEWCDITDEADPNFVPRFGEVHGLRNMHVFGLANCLHRPIILIDGLEGLYSKGDYCAVFLPYLVPLEQCKDKNGQLHKPVLISWSSKGRNHFVPLVGIQGKPLPKFPQYLLPKVWGLPQELLTKYIDFTNETCVIGGSKSLSEKYLLKLVTAMENHFRILNGIAPSVVGDVYHHISRPSGVIGLSSEMVTETALAMVKEERLHKCLLCQSVMEEVLPCSLTWLQPGGKLYEIAKSTHGSLKDGYQYRFPSHGNIMCSYNAERNILRFVQDVETMKCKHCSGALRVVKTDGTLGHINGDQLAIPASKNSRCGCGYKHYWDGKHYDNLPLKVPILLEWNNTKKEDFVYWFQFEADDTLNSNAFTLGHQLVKKHFPGEFGSERLVEKVVDQIFCFVLKDSPEDKSIPCISTTNDLFGSDPATTLNKIILKGTKSKTLHKEELNVSKTEQVLRKTIEHHAVVKQKRLSASSPHKVLSNKMSPERLVEVKKDVQQISVTRKKERRIRISLIEAGNETYTLSDTTTFLDIQNFIEEKFKLKKELQIIKYGFPPKTLQPSDQYIDLKHGERLVVHTKKLPKNETINLVTNVMDTDSHLSSGAASQSNKQTSVDLNTSALANSLFSLLDNVDIWKWACADRRMFKCSGLFYNQAVNDLGILQHDQHISLPCFPSKLFQYDSTLDELLLCLGPTHIPVRILTDEELVLAHKQTLQNKQTLHKKDGHQSSSAAVKQKHDEKMQIFHGEGHTLKPLENKESDETKMELDTTLNIINDISPSPINDIQPIEMQDDNNLSR